MVNYRLPESPSRSPLPSAERLPAPRLVDTPAAFAEMLNILAGEQVLALDTESDSLYRYFYRVCLIQLSTCDTDFILDPLALPDLAPLGAILADPTVEKVFHAAENDILVLKRDYGFSFASIFDTMLAARVLGRPRVSLAALLAEHFGVELDKRAQLTDWGHRPLTPEQLRYARLDSRYLIPLRNLFIQELQEHHRWREAQETFAALPQVAYVEKPFDPDGFWRSKGVRDMRPTELAVFRELYLWRDTQARAMNRPPFKVLSDQILVQLSQTQPRRTGDLPLNAWQVNRFGEAILEAIERGRVAPTPQYPARQRNGDGRPDPAALARFDRLRAWRTKRASERGVESDVVLNNETLMAIARSCPADLAELAGLGLLGAWKIEEYGADLLRVLTIET